MEVDIHGEQDLFGEEFQESSQEEGEISDKELTELAEDDLDTDQILHLAAE